MYINNKGEEVLRVSNIIKILNKEELLYWANSLGFKHISYKKEIEKEAYIGTTIHSLIYDFLSKKRICFMSDDLFNVGFNDRYKIHNGMKSFLLWYNENKEKYNVLYMEKTVIGDSYGGTIDCIIKSTKSNSGFILVDYKTSKNFYLTHFLQLSAYSILCEEYYDMKIDGVMVILIDKKNGNKARSKYISIKKLKPFKVLFNQLLMVKTLNDNINIENETEEF